MVSGIQTQGGPSDDKSVTAFRVQTGIDACEMEYVSDSYVEPKVSLLSR